MPNAEIQCSFSEGGCDFYGMTYATKGSSQTRVEDISTIRDLWVSKNYTEDQIEDEAFEDEISDAWYNVADDMIIDASDAILADLKAEFKESTHELKGSALVDAVRKVNENLLIHQWTDLEITKAMIFAGYLNKALLDRPNGLLKEKDLERAYKKFQRALQGTSEYINAQVKAWLPHT